jgi:hypothetical protein
MKQNRASKFATMEEPLLSFVRQARDHNLPLTCEIINIKAKEFAEKLGNEPKPIHKCKPSVFYKVQVSSTQGEGCSRNLSDAMVFHEY